MSEGRELSALIAALARPSALVELGVLALCLGLAWLLVRAIAGGRRTRHSIWFGERHFDGVLFPVLALGLAFAARWGLAQTMPVAVFRLAVPILLSLLVIRVAVRVLQVAFPASPVVRAVERTLSWLVWLGLVLWVTGLLPLMLEQLEAVHWKVGATDVSLRSLIEGVFTAVAVLLLALWLSAAIEARLLRGELGNLSLRKILANVTRALLLFVGLLLALSAAGIPLGALSVFGGAVGVGVGFGLQKLASNYVSGFVILAERSLHIGDMVKVDNFEGRITDINTRYTVIKALNGREANVPNEMLITQRVENYSRADPNMAVTTVFHVAYGSAIEPLKQRLLEVVAAVPRVLDKPAPELWLSAFTLEGLELTLQFFINDPLKGTLNVKSAVNFAVLRVLDELDIAIPQPRSGFVIDPPRPPAA